MLDIESNILLNCRDNNLHYGRGSAIPLFYSFVKILEKRQQRIARISGKFATYSISSIYVHELQILQIKRRHTHTHI